MSNKNKQKYFFSGQRGVQWVWSWLNLVFGANKLHRCDLVYFGAHTRICLFVKIKRVWWKVRWYHNLIAIGFICIFNACSYVNSMNCWQTWLTNMVYILLYTCIWTTTCVQMHGFLLYEMKSFWWHFCFGWLWSNYILKLREHRRAEFIHILISSWR